RGLPQPLDDLLVRLAAEAAAAMIRRCPNDPVLRLQRARTCFQLGWQGEAYAQLDRALEQNPALALGPGDAPLGAGRLHDEAHRGRWAAAAAWNDRLAGLAPDAPEVSWCRALLALHRGDDAGYREAAGPMLKRFGDVAAMRQRFRADGVDGVYFSALISLLRPPPEEDLARAAGAADALLGEDKSPPAQGRAKVVKGMADYRAG